MALIQRILASKLRAIVMNNDELLNQYNCLIRKLYPECLRKDCTNVLLSTLNACSAHDESH